MRLRFDGAIASTGSGSGTRLVIGMWRASPFGPITDVMVEDAAGHRTLVAPTSEVADFIAATYHFDEVQVEETVLEIGDAGVCTFTSASLQLSLGIGRRTGLGRVLAAVPGPIARSPRWCRAIDPIARRMRPGVRTVGTAGGGRREYYGATDEHVITEVRGLWRGADLGPLRPVTPPVRFGFGSAPARPSLVRITTLIYGATPD
jgi:hypothetical protein